MSSNDDSILAQIGLVGRREKTNVGGLDGLDGRKDNGSVAIKALRDLIECGKVSLEDARAAVKSARGSNVATPDATSTTKEEAGGPPNDDDDDNGDDGNGIGNGTKNNRRKAAPKRDKHRTRHVALEFSYEGSDFTGFAENLRKRFDNSVEKTLFAALTKACLLVSPEENGTLMEIDDGGVYDQIGKAIEDAKRSEDAKIGEKGGENGTKGGDGAEGWEGEGRDDSGNARTNRVDDARAAYLRARGASRYSRCGRTDRGVHARRQVVALYLRSAFPPSARSAGPIPTASTANDGPGTDGSGPGGDSLREEDLPKNSLAGLECLVPPRRKRPKGRNDDGNNADDVAPFRRKTMREHDYPRVLNNILPPSVRVLGWCPVTPQFSARFSCSRRTYRYFFPRRDLDLSAMAEGLQHAMGRHDFRNFCKINLKHEQVHSFERELFEGRVASPQEAYELSSDSAWPSIRQNLDALSVAGPHDMCHVEIVGQTFLWHQMRCMMSALFHVGRGLEPPTAVRDLLDVTANPAKPSYEMAAEAGLVLHDCKFVNLRLGRTAKNLWGANKVLEERWERHAVAAARANDALECLANECEVRWTDVVEFVETIARDRERKGKKRERKGGSSLGEVGDGGMERARRALEESAPPEGRRDAEVISWASAIRIIRDALGIHPHLPSGTGESHHGHTESSIHVPLLERSKGTTYKEKVKSILELAGNRRRREQYEKELSKKKNTKEEDRRFYDQMLRQGGSCI